MHTDLRTLCVEAACTLLEAMGRIDANKLGIALVVDANRRLIGTVTDGDIRRAILAHVDLQQPVQAVLARKAGTHYATPVTAPVGLDRAACLALLKTHKLLHLPLVDADGRVVGLITSDEFLRDQSLPVRAVVMAGGRGARLHPLTAEVPKPMLQVGDRPLLEIIVGQLRDAGIRHVKITMHHQPEKIAGHFGDGRDFGVELSYVAEHEPLGTVGGLSLLEPPMETTLVMNGDILTEVDFRAMLAYHKEHEADLTVAVRYYEITVPYGVVECEGSLVRKLSEKPVMRFFVNAGMYLLEPMAYQFIPSGRRFDMTDLIQALLAQGRRVVSFPVREHWIDIGQHADYELAKQRVTELGVSP